MKIGSLQRRRELREILFCLLGDDDKQNHLSFSKNKVFCPIVVSRLGRISSFCVLCVSAVKFFLLLLAAVYAHDRLFTAGQTEKGV